MPVLGGGRGSAPPSPVPVAAAVHDIHASHIRMVLEGRTVALRVRLFHDDLLLALRAFTNRPDLQLTTADRADSAFGAYFAKVVRFEADGQAPTLRVTSSAAEPDQVAGIVVWYVLEGQVAATPSHLTMLNGLLFEVFDDQQNIVQILRMPGEERRTLYFTAREPKPQDLSF
jgi:hypothetical protein